MQDDEELLAIMNKYKPGSGRQSPLTQSDHNMGFEPATLSDASDEEEDSLSEEPIKAPAASPMVASTENVSTQQSSAEQTIPPLADVAKTVATTPNPNESVAVGVVATTPPPLQETADEPASAVKGSFSDKDALDLIRSRFEELWRLEREHAELKQKYADLEQAKQEVEKQRGEWEAKTIAAEAKIVELNKTLEGEKDKYQEQEKRVKELNDTNAKLNKKLEGEKERYDLLSGQFEELNNKLVEIVTNVTHMKTDELVKLRSPRKGDPSSQQPATPVKPAPAAASGGGFSSFFSLVPQPATPVKGGGGGNKGGAGAAAGGGKTK